MKGKFLISILSILVCLSCNDALDYQNIFWGMSQKKVSEKMKDSGYTLLSMNKRRMNYKFNINENIYHCLFHFTLNKQLWYISIYPENPYRLYREKCDALLPGLKGYVEKDFGNPVKEYDSGEELERKIHRRSKWYVYRKGKTMAWLAYLDYGGNRFLFNVLIGPDTYIEKKMEVTLGKDYKIKYYK